MRFFLFSLFLFSSVCFADEPFEGCIDYSVKSGASDFSYRVWVKGSLWRSELSSGNQLYELRLGNSETGEAYLVNDGGESYRSLSHMMGAGSARPPRPQGEKKPKELDLEKLVSNRDDAKELLGIELRLEEVRGPGKKMSFWWSDELGSIPALALPRLKGFEGKEQLLAAYFRERGRGTPMVIEIPKASGKNAFSIVATKVESIELEASFLSLQDGYRPEAGGRPAGGGPGGGGRRGGEGGGRPPRPM